MLLINVTIKLKLLTPAGVWTELIIREHNKEKVGRFNQVSWKARTGKIIKKWQRKWRKGDSELILTETEMLLEKNASDCLSLDLLQTLRKEGC